MDDVAPAVRVAGWFRRSLAAFVDLVVLLPLLLLCGALVWFVHGSPLPRSTDDLIAVGLDLLLEGNLVLLIFAAVAACVWLSYEFVFCALAGATLGMQLLQLRVVDENVMMPTVRHAAMRTLALAVAALPLGIGLIWIAFDPHKRGLHDHLTRSYVVLARKSRASYTAAELR